MKYKNYNLNSAHKGCHYKVDPARKGRCHYNVGKDHPMYGKKRPDTSEMNRLRLKGKKNPIVAKTNKERTWTDEMRKNAGKNKRGENNPNWKDGRRLKIAKIRGRIEYRLWKEAVLARDNWTCRDCGKQKVRLHAHHLKSFTLYPQLRFAIDNGIILCAGCHRKLHSKINKEKENGKIVG